MCPCGTGYPCRCGALRGACFVCRLPTLPLACFSAPYPPSPLPRRGRGRFKVFLCKGLRPLHPGACSARHWLSLPLWCPAGWRRGRSPANPAFSFPFAPYPPAPLPQRGRGSPKVYFAGGFAPGTPALSRSRHLQPLPSGYPGGRTRAALAIPAAVVPGGGLLCLPSAYPAFSFPSCPHPPRPLPGGKGESQSLFRRGLRPRHPCIRPFAAFTNLSEQEPGAKGSPRFAARMARNAFLWTVPAAKERGDPGEMELSVARDGGV